MSVLNDTDRGNAFLHGRVRLPQAVVHRSFVKETVVLNLDTGLYHGLNPTAGRMLETLERVGSVKETVRLLSQEYGVDQAEVEADVLEFCEALVGRGLLELQPPTT